MIPPIVFIAGMKLAEKLFSSGGGSRGAPAPQSSAPDFTLYSVPKHGLKGFIREHPDVISYSDCARKLAQAGYHRESTALTARGDELMRQYDGERYIVCADFRPG